MPNQTKDKTKIKTPAEITTGVKRKAGRPKLIDGGKVTTGDEYGKTHRSYAFHTEILTMFELCCKQDNISPVADLEKYMLQRYAASSKLFELESEMKAKCKHDFDAYIFEINKQKEDRKKKQSKIEAEAEKELNDNRLNAIQKMIPFIRSRLSKFNFEADTKSYAGEEHQAVLGEIRYELSKIGINNINDNDIKLAYSQVIAENKA